MNTTTKIAGHVQFATSAQRHGLKFWLGAFVIGSALSSVAPNTVTAQTVLEDSTFNNADWSSMSQSYDDDIAAGISFGQVSSGGNPGSYMSFTVTQPTSQFARYSIFSAILGTSLEYNPSTQGAISAMALSFDIDLAGSGGAYVIPFLEQGGNYYSAPPLNYVSTNGWRTYSGQIPLNSFGSAVAESAINLSSTGAPIIFGLGVSEESSVPVNVTFGVDNLTYTVTTAAPEPSTGILLFVSLAPLMWRRRFRPVLMS